MWLWWWSREVLVERGAGVLTVTRLEMQMAAVVRVLGGKERPNNWDRRKVKSRQWGCKWVVKMEAVATRLQPHRPPWHLYHMTIAVIVQRAIQVGVQVYLNSVIPLLYGMLNTPLNLTKVFPVQHINRPNLRSDNEWQKRKQNLSKGRKTNTLRDPEWVMIRRSRWDATWKSSQDKLENRKLFQAISWLLPIWFLEGWLIFHPS